jgi:hypothetical protein
MSNTARTTPLARPKVLGNQKVLKGRSFEELLQESYAKQVDGTVKLPEPNAASAAINAPTALLKISDVPKGDHPQPPDIQDITLVSKNATRAGVPVVRVCDSTDSRSILLIYTQPPSARATDPSALRTSGASGGVRTSGASGGVRTSGGAGTRGSGGATNAGGAGTRGSGGAGTRGSGGATNAGGGSGIVPDLDLGGADTSGRPFRLLSLVGPLPPISIRHPLEGRDKPTIPRFEAMGVPEAW